MNVDAITARAAKRAVNELGHLETFTRAQRSIIASEAVLRARRSLDCSVPLAVLEAQLLTAARTALSEALRFTGEADRRAVRRAPLGGVELLPEDQQVVWSLRFKHDLSDADIAMVLGLLLHDVNVLTALMFENLWVQRR